jgi:hypothetical protein
MSDSLEQINTATNSELLNIAWTRQKTTTHGCGEVTLYFQVCLLRTLQPRGRQFIKGIDSV